VEASTELLINCFWPPQHFICREVLPTWRTSIEEATGGRVSIRFLAKSMAAPQAQWESVVYGVFDGAVQFNGFIDKQVVGTQVSMTPFSAIADPEAMSVALWRTYEEFMAGAGEYDGVKLIGLFVSPGADFYSLTDIPITSLDTMTNRKMWANPGVVARLLKELDVPVVSSPAVQMNEIISRGIVDGFVGIAASDAFALNVLPYARSVTVTRRKIFSPTFSFFLSKKKWNEISLADQAAIMSVSGEAFARLAGSVWARYETKALGSIGQRVQLIKASDAFESMLIDASEAFTEQWIESANAQGIDGAAALEFYRATAIRLAAP
jgi:TRAP-type C4-dicarboxylate transport system substrate-binding protein